MKKLAFYILIISFISLTNCSDKYRETSWEVVSPSGTLKFKLETGTEKESGMLFYSVNFCEKEKETNAINKSHLGIAHSKSDFTKELHAVGSSISHLRNFKYTMLTGKRKLNKTSANCMEVEFVNFEGDTMVLNAMIFDEGVAFSYTIPGSGGEIELTQEITDFNIGLGGKAWIQPYDTASKYTPAYEHGYINEMNIGTSSPSTAGWGFPALFDSNGLWILVSEAGLTENYCGTHLGPVCENGEYKIQFPSENESFGIGSSYPISKTPLTTPWRYILIGKTLATIVESNMSYHLSEPSRLEDVSWIKPGRASWSWWSDHSSSSNFSILKSFVDLAATMGWEYSLVDANWDLMTGGSAEKLIEYAKSKNVGILLWYNSGGPNNNVTERPRDMMYEPVPRNAEMERISKLGVKGIKVDFFQSDKQNIIKLYLDIAKDAARHKLLLNSHGCTIPRGWTKTYPNFIGMEGVLGAEAYTFSNFAEIAPVQNTTNPFTRNVIGPMDYTPVIFTNYDNEHVRLTSDAHELALSVVFECGILHFADRVSGYRNLPAKVIEYLKEVPVRWDDTWFIDGYPGKYIVLGRKSNDNYYLAGITGEEGGKELNLKPEFLDNGSYKARLFGDGYYNRSLDIRDFEYTKGENIPVRMDKFGGFSLVLKKK